MSAGRERVRMLSWVAMERIYEHEVLPDPKLRKQAGERPLRAHAKRLTDGELLAKLRSFGVEIDRAWLEQKCEQALSAQEIAGPLMDQSGNRGQESDWIWICVATLWRRWFPEQPSFEELDDKMQAGYELLKTNGAVAACRPWLEACDDGLRLLDKAGIKSIEGFDERFRGTQSMFNWIQDLESELWNAGLEDRQFLSARIALAKHDANNSISLLKDAVAIQDRLNYGEPPDWFFPVREPLGAALLMNGNTAEAEKVFREDLNRNPRNPRSLFGLREALKGQHRSYDASFVDKQFQASWRSADAQLQLQDLT